MVTLTIRTEHKILHFKQLCTILLIVAPDVGKLQSYTVFLFSLKRAVESSPLNFKFLGNSVAIKKLSLVLV